MMHPYFLNNEGNYLTLTLWLCIDEMQCVCLGFGFYRSIDFQRRFIIDVKLRPSIHIY